MCGSWLHLCAVYTSAFLSRKHIEMQTHGHEIIMVILNRLWFILKSKSFSNFDTSTIIRIQLLATHQCVLLRPAGVNIERKMFKLMIN